MKKSRIELLKIRGGNPLEGKVVASGAKNATTKLLVASLLSDKKCIFSNVPNIGDVEITVNLCREIGSEVQWDKENKVLEIQTKELKTTYIPQRFSGANRIPILMIGALLGRTNEDIIVPTVGGDKVGTRPVNFHVMALEKLGAHIEYRDMKKEGAYFAHAHSGLRGTVIDLPYPSVGATENAMMAGVHAKGKTVIRNAATEPEITELILFLQKLGVNISWGSANSIHIEKAEVFYETQHTLLADRNEVASYAIAALSTKGKIFIEGAEHRNMISFLPKIRDVGGKFTIHSNGIEFAYTGKLKGGVIIETDVHPGFMTDWQQPFGVLLTQAEGCSVIHETVYEDRFGYTQTLKDMGAHVELVTNCLGSSACRFASKSHVHSLIVHGPTELQARNFSVPDLRAGFAYVIAALLAKDESTISGVYYLDRGYANLFENLKNLGADVELLSMDPESGEKKVSLTSS